MIDWTAITAVVGSIATVAGSFGGYLLAGNNEEKRDERASVRETEARKAAFRERLEEERHNFQRDTFLALQDQLLELARQHALVASQDMKTLKSEGKLLQLPDDLGGEEARLRVALADKLRTRVLDNELRGAIRAFMTLCTKDSTGLNGVPAERAIREIERRDLAVAVAYEDIAERLGTHLRMEIARRV
jgi:hypothetical protein